MASSKLQYQQHQHELSQLARSTARTVAVVLAKTTVPDLLTLPHRLFILPLAATVRTSHSLVLLAVIGLSFLLVLLAYL